MNEQDITTTAADVDIDLDDVEAHGIKEVMVGLSAAAVLTGGVAAVVGGGSDGSGPSTAKARIAADNLGDVDGTGASASTSGTESAIDSSGVLGGTGVALGNDSVSLRSAHAIGGTVLDADADTADDDGDVTVSVNTGDLIDYGFDTAEGALRDARTTVRNVPGTISQTRSTVDTTISNTGQTVDRTVSDARATVRNTKATVNEVKDAAISDVNRTLDATLVFANDTVRGVEGTVNTLAGRVMPGASADIDASTLTGTVTITVGGEQVAKADVKNGTFTVSYTAPRADAPIQVHYTGPLGSIVRGL